MQDYIHADGLRKNDLVLLPCDWNTEGIVCRVISVDTKPRDVKIVFAYTVYFSGNQEFTKHLNPDHRLFLVKSAPPIATRVNPLNRNPYRR